MNKTLKRTLTGLVLITLAVNLYAQSNSEVNAASENEKKNYMGWIDASKRDVNVKVGNIRMNAKTRLGTFNISVENENGKKISVLNSGNEYTSTGFFLKANNKIYRLIAESNIKTSARKTEDGMQINYSVKNTADVLVDFKCMKSAPENGYDMVKITSTVINTGNKKVDFALKLILDTVLGESGNEHFYTSADVPVKAEAIYRTMQNEKWFVSKNDQAQMQILLDGGDVTSPEVVALANYSTLEKNTWEPEMLVNRTFDTVLSYNNSAVGIIWPVKKLGVESRFSNCFYLGLGADGTVPQGDVYLASKKDSTINLMESVEKLGMTKEDSVEVADISDKIEIIELDMEPAIKPVEPAPPVVVEVTPLPNVPQNTPKNKDLEKYNSAYIQELIDRISVLQSQPDLASEDEINLLNAELDAILQALM